MDDFAITDKYLKTTLYHINITGDRGIDDTVLMDGPEEYYSLSLDETPSTAQTIAQNTSTKSTVNISSKTTNDNNTSTRDSDNLNTVNTYGAVFKSSRRNVLSNTESEGRNSDTRDAHLLPNSFAFRDSFNSYDSSSEGSEEPSSTSSEIDINSIQMFRTDTEEKFILEKKISDSSNARTSEKHSRSFNLKYLQDLEAQNSSKTTNNNSTTTSTHIRPNLTVKTAFSSSQSPEMQPTSRKSNTNTSVAAPVVTTYITIQGRRSAADEWKLIMKIPVKNGKPMVHTAGPSGLGNSSKSPNIDMFVPNPRDIAIQTPTKGMYHYVLYLFLIVWLLFLPSSWRTHIHTFVRTILSAILFHCLLRTASTRSAVPTAADSAQHERQPSIGDFHPDAPEFPEARQCFVQPISQPARPLRAPRRRQQGMNYLNLCDNIVSRLVSFRQYIFTNMPYFHYAFSYLSPRPPRRCCRRVAATTASP